MPLCHLRVNVLLPAGDILLQTARRPHRQCEAATHRYKYRGTFEGRSSFLSIHYGHRPSDRDNNDSQRAPYSHPPPRPPLRPVYFLLHCYHHHRRRHSHDHRTH
ncbi:hypothetical protein E2C01_001598 [Portunus trituberculatus]|uniref:Uncharacterized protein n=1 Tax=Portunus trituberculatus TaxID=210409 RepID=A0A5B7CHQ5_PORTR|nr:hypothetical protein [Portunus trituberculatus]